MLAVARATWGGRLLRPRAHRAIAASHRPPLVAPLPARLLSAPAQGPDADREREEAALRLKNALAEQKKKPVTSTLKRAASGKQTLVRAQSSLVQISPHIKQMSEVLPARTYVGALLAAGKSTVSGVASIPGLLKWAGAWVWQSFVEAYRQPSVLKKWYLEGKDSAKHGLEHIVTGFKVLWLDLKTTTRLLSYKIADSRALTRRENQQLARTYKDMQSMVPFLVILIVPFLEFALPVLLKVFPNMLPSSFQTSSQKQDMAKSIGEQRTELASYVQEMVADVEKRVKAKALPETAQTINALVDFVERSRTHRPLDPSTIPLLVKTFSDELTLERMSRTQLQLLCRYMGAPVLGSDSYLRFALLAKMKALRADDLQIYAEGVNELTLDELKKAALDRGMRAESDDIELYREQLARWIELSVIHNVSPTMLILSRAFAVMGARPTPDKVLKSLESELVQDALSNAVDQASPGAVDSNVLSKAKLESVQGQNRLIEDEKKARTPEQ